MPVSKKQQASVNKYIKEKYDTYRITFPKGKKAELQTHAESKGESLNGFINRAIDNQVVQDNAVEAFTVEPIVKKGVVENDKSKGEGTNASI